MCTTCGCGGNDTLINGMAVSRRNLNRPSNRNGDAPSAGRLLFRPHHHHDPAPAAAAIRRVQVERNILAKNDALAADNRAFFAGHNILALNLVSSPGSGKTTLLVRTIESLKGRVAMAVIEGDQQTDNDAERIRATGVHATQINTGKGCHLDAEMVGHALDDLPPLDGGVLFIENVGNLVCPAAFDLGEAAKVVVLSVTEGEDKPLKYPDMFRAAQLLLLNKCDLLPHLSFDIELAESHARRVNPDIRIIRLSATSGEGMNDWVAWLDAQRTTITKRT
ncbi:MAG: hydrogenase nickel incorporation protein HypB [Betaproteobacteria bacterium]|nr:hydrogenase nickel incorporation protein HypB [Betaproteobacteria bacterium]